MTLQLNKSNKLKLHSGFHLLPKFLILINLRILSLLSIPNCEKAEYFSHISVLKKYFRKFIITTKKIKMTTTTAASKCQQYDLKKMECQMANCGICVKLPCMSGAGKCCSDAVKIECCKPEELEKCCQTSGNECCICVECHDGKLVKAVVQCCGKRQELGPVAAGNALCFCVPQKEGACGGQVQVKECPASQVENCCRENQASGECCCVCVQCRVGEDGTANCQALVSCPTAAGNAATSSGTGCCGGGSKPVPCC